MLSPWTAGTEVASRVQKSTVRRPALNQGSLLWRRSLLLHRRYSSNMQEPVCLILILIQSVQKPADCLHTALTGKLHSDTTQYAYPIPEIPVKSD